MYRLIPFFFIALVLFGCGPSSEEEAEKSKVEELEAELEAERAKQEKLESRLDELEEQIETDSNSPEGRVEQFLDNDTRVSVRVDLSELTEKQLDTYKNSLGLKPSLPQQTVSGSKGTFGKLIREVIEERILTDRLSELDFIEKQSWIRDSYWSYILAQLPENVNIGRELYTYVDREGERAGMLAHLVFRTDRSANHLAELWDTFGSFALDVIPESTYRSSNLSRYVNSLIQVRDHFRSEGISSDDLEDIYAEVMERERSSEYPLFSTETWDIYQPYLDDDILSEWMEAQDGADTYQVQWRIGAADALWFHSFWVRRNHEGNAGIVYNILKEIQEHYNP